MERSDFKICGFDQGWGAHPDKSSVVELKPDGIIQEYLRGEDAVQWFISI